MDNTDDTDIVDTEESVAESGAGSSIESGRRQKKIDLIVDRLIQRFRGIQSLIPSISDFKEGVWKFSNLVQSLPDDIMTLDADRCRESLDCYRAMITLFDPFRNFMAEKIGGKIPPRFQKVATITQAVNDPSILKNFFRVVGEVSVTNRKVPGCSQSQIRLRIPVDDFDLEDRGLKVRMTGFVIQITVPISDEEPLRTLITSDMGADGYCHPHVSTGHLCSGDLRYQESMARETWDIPLLYQIMWTVLHSYTREGAYRPLESFSPVPGGRCNGHDCRKWFPQEHIEKEFVRCSLCHLLYCPECFRKDMETLGNHYGCYLCIEEREQKKRQMGEEFAFEVKKNWRCYSCQQSGVTLRKCSECGKTFCRRHSKDGLKSPDTCGNPGCTVCNRNRICERCKVEQKEG